MDRDSRNPYLVGSFTPSQETTEVKLRPYEIVAFAALLFLFAQACKLESGTVVPGGTINVDELPAGPSEVNESVCVGVSPDPSAWMAEPFPIRFPKVDADATGSQGIRTDIIADVSGEVMSAARVPDATDRGASGAPGAPGPEPAGDEPESTDPCVLQPGTCMGAPPPEWALLDFQPQSCGSGATYGLQAFHGHVTVMALFASW